MTFLGKSKKLNPLGFSTQKSMRRLICYVAVLCMAWVSFASAQTVIYPLTIAKRSDGKLKYTVTFGEARTNVQLFAKKNGTQHLTPLMTQTNNGNGTYTYSYDPDPTVYINGDSIVARVYSSINGTQLFTPGPTSSTWTAPYTYANNAAPIASFTISCTGLTCNVNASASSDPEAQALTYSWNWGDSTGNGSGVTASHAYANGTNRTVTLTVTDTGAATGTTTKTATPNIAPTANFTSTCTNEVCSFTNTSTDDAAGGISSYLWNFGDSTTSTSQNPTKNYTSRGNKTVTLTVTDNEGAISSPAAAKTVTIANVAPVANFTASCSQLVCTFTNTSTDIDGTLYSYAWNFGDSYASTAASPSHTYAAAGTYDVYLTVTDNNSAIGATTKSVTTKTIGTIKASWVSATNKVKYTVTYAEDHNNTALWVKKNALGDHIANQTMVEVNNGDGTFTYTWDLDGSAYVSGDIVRFRVYSTLHTGGTQVYTPGPGTADYTSWNYVTNVPPSVNFTASCPTSGTTCTFNATASDSDSAGIASYAWTFGDGQSSTLEDPAHTYSANGNYSVTVTVTDQGPGTAAVAQASNVVLVDYPVPVPNFGDRTSGSTITFFVNSACTGAIVYYGVNAPSSTYSQNMFTAPATTVGGGQEFNLTGNKPGDVINFNFTSCTNSSALSYTFPVVKALYDTSTVKQANSQYLDSNGYLVTQLGDRVHNRHTKGFNEQNYLSFKQHYFRSRSSKYKITDKVSTGISEIIFEIETDHELIAARDFRYFYTGGSNKVDKWRINASGNNTTELVEDITNDSVNGLTAAQKINTETGDTSRKKYRHIITSYKRVPESQTSYRPLAVGDYIEFEMGGVHNPIDPGDENYYYSIFLYKVGTGVVPWDTKTRLPGIDGLLDTADDTFTNIWLDTGSLPAFDGNPWFSGTSTTKKIMWDSAEITNREALLGGKSTVQANWSFEFQEAFRQPVINMSSNNMNAFLRGRRVAHTSFVNAGHNEKTMTNERDTSNDNFPWADNKIKAQFANDSCESCHKRNSNGVVPAIGQNLDTWLVKIGDANSSPEPARGKAIQPKKIQRDANGTPARTANAIKPTWYMPNVVTSDEGTVSIYSIDTSYGDGRRSFTYNFSAGAPAKFSARIAPRLVGMGLKDAVKESDIIANANYQPVGITGRVRTVNDPQTGDLRVGRFGWKGSEASLRHQIARALAFDMGMPNNIYGPDCGSAQINCASSGDRFAYDLAVGDGIKMYDTATSDNRPYAGNAGGGYGTGVAGSSRITNTAFDDTHMYFSLLGIQAARLDGYIDRITDAAKAVEGVSANYVTKVEVETGKALFYQIGCNSCHKAGPAGNGGPNDYYLTSEHHPLPELRNIEFRPYSDFLLHNMGTGLADTLNEGNVSSGGAEGGEWLTPMLIGLGSQACATGGEAGWNSGSQQWDPNMDGKRGENISDFGARICQKTGKETYLHDGRATTLEQAILWHGTSGSEAQTSVDAYNALSSTQKTRLVDFLKAL